MWKSQIVDKEKPGLPNEIAVWQWKVAVSDDLMRVNR